MDGMTGWKYDGMGDSRVTVKDTPRVARRETSEAKNGSKLVSSN